LNFLLDILSEPIDGKEADFGNVLVTVTRTFDDDDVCMVDEIYVRMSAIEYKRFEDENIDLTHDAWEDIEDHPTVAKLMPDGRQYGVRYTSSYEPITDDEYEVLKKFIPISSYV
jgi:hypothetical protein